jgi:hypothetical protein
VMQYYERTAMHHCIVDQMENNYLHVGHQKILNTMASLQKNDIIAHDSLGIEELQALKPCCLLSYTFYHWLRVCAATNREQNRGGKGLSCRHCSTGQAKQTNTMLSTRVLLLVASPALSGLGWARRR